MQSDAKTVNAYLQEAPEERQTALAKLRSLCVEILDGYSESMEYGMPGYKREGEEISVAFASQKNYISLYILREDVLDKFREQLSGLNLGKGCIRYRKPEQIDFQVVREMLAESSDSKAPIC